MSRLKPCRRKDFIRSLRKIGFDGIYSGRRHQFMLFGQNRLTIPSNYEFSVPQLKMMLREVEAITRKNISIDEWNDL